jgi:membrane peptidoglycan carboxypeptidase
LSLALRQPSQRFEVSKPMRVSRFTITDYHPHNKPLNVPEILIYSSNIGSARMAEAIGAETQRAFMDKLGLLDRLEIEIPETSRPLSPRSWHRTTTVTVSYGHGISISPAHLASAVAAASGNGHWIQPTLLKRQTGDSPLRLRVFSEQTARAVRSMMRLVISHEDGTGNFAEARGYMVGGKTGTAEKIQVGGYNKKANLATFVATFPVHDPRYVIVILVDEPKGQKHSHGYATAGWVVAPAIRRIVEQIAPMLGVLPVDEKSPLIRQKLLLDLRLVMRRQHLHLTDLCHDLINIPDQTGAIMVTGLAFDSKRVAAGNLFFALTGSHRDGRDFIDDAINAGAAAIVTGIAPLAKDIAKAAQQAEIPILQCENPRRVMAKMAAIHWSSTTRHGCRCYRYKW